MSDEERLRESEKLAQAANEEQDALIRGEMMYALGAFPSAVASSTLYAAIKDPDRDIRIAACRAWGRRGDADAARVLGEIVAADTDRDVRLAALRGLGQVHDPAAVAAAGVALEDVDPAMQHRAVASLRKITGKNFGNDVNAWRAYVQGTTPQPREQSLVSRLRQLF